MQAHDIVIVNVTGTNGSTRNQKTITRRFNGAGQALDDNGQPNGSVEVLRNLPNGVSTPPEFPMAQYQAAAKAGNLEEMKAIQLAAAKALETWEKSQGGGSELLQIAKAVLEYTKEFHDFVEKDQADKFVMTLDNLEVVPTTMKDGRRLFTVTGAAVFG